MAALLSDHFTEVTVVLYMGLIIDLQYMYFVVTLELDTINDNDSSI